jgi:hypothetical protein
MAVLTPNITVGANDGFIGVTFFNSVPVTFNYLKRNGIYIGKTIGSSELDPSVGFFNDYQTRNGEQVFYTGSAFDGTQESAPTAPHTGTVTLSSVFIHKVMKGVTSNADGIVLELFNLEGQKVTQSREGNVLRLAAQEKPRIRTASQTQRIVECPILIRNEDVGEIIPTLEEMIWSNSLHCFRDALGELIYGTFPSQEMKIDINRNINLVLWESAFNEAIL